MSGSQQRCYKIDFEAIELSHSIFVARGVSAYSLFSVNNNKDVAPEDYFLSL